MAPSAHFVSGVGTSEVAAACQCVLSQHSTQFPMRVLTIAALGVVSATRCTNEQEELYTQLVNASSDCTDLLKIFYLCDDKCLSAFNDKAEKAPDCTLSNSASAVEEANLEYDRCDNKQFSNQALKADKYVPIKTPGAAGMCTNEAISEWTSKYMYTSESGPSRAFICLTADYTNAAGCVDDCFEVLQRSVKDAPACLLTENYSFAETKKPALFQCVKARKEDPKKNEALQITLSKGGKLESASTTVALSTAVALASLATVMCTL